MTFKIKWTGENPVVFYDGETRIELKKDEKAEVRFMPSGGGFKLLDQVDLDLEQTKLDFIELENKLTEFGLSPIRKSKVLSRIKSIEQIKSNLDNLPFDEITNNFLKTMGTYSLTSLKD